MKKIIYNNVTYVLGIIFVLYLCLCLSYSLSSRMLVTSTCSTYGNFDTYVSVNETPSRYICYNKQNDTIIEVE